MNTNYFTFPRSFGFISTLPSVEFSWLEEKVKIWRMPMLSSMHVQMKRSNVEKRSRVVVNEGSNKLEKHSVTIHPIKMVIWEPVSKPTVEKRVTFVHDATSHSVELDILTGIWSPIPGRKSTAAHNAIIQPVELAVWENTSQPTVDKRTTIVHNATSHSV